MAAAIKELRQAVLPTMVALVRHYTMVAIAQQAVPFPMNTKQNKLNGMDPLVLIDAMAVIMGHEEKGKKGDKWGKICQIATDFYVIILINEFEILLQNFANPATSPWFSSWTLLPTF